MRWGKKCKEHRNSLFFRQKKLEYNPTCIFETASVPDPYSLNPDRDPAKNINPDPDPGGP